MQGQTVIETGSGKPVGFRGASERARAIWTRSAHLHAGRRQPSMRRIKQAGHKKALRMDDIHVVRLCFVDYHSACSLLLRGRRRTRRKAASRPAAGYNRGLEAATPGTGFCAGTLSPKINRPLRPFPSGIIRDPAGNHHAKTKAAPETRFRIGGERSQANHAGFLKPRLKRLDRSPIS